MRSLVTSVLDLVGMVLLVAAAAVWAASIALPLGLAVGGLGLLGASLLIDRRTAPKPPGGDDR